MPSVNTLITAIVAGLAIGTHAGPCRPHGSSSSVSTAGVVTTTSTQPSTTYSRSYPSVSSNSETKTAGTTSITEPYETKTSQSASATSNSVTVSETTTDVGARGSSGSETISTTVADTTSVTYKVETTSTSAEETTTAPSSTSSTTAPSSTTSNESTTQGTTTTTLETRTSAASATTTSAAPSQTSGPSCLVCGKTGYLGSDSSGHLLDDQQDTDFETCKTRCKETDKCVTIGYTADISKCELYDAAPATLEMTDDPASWYTIYEACCFE